MKAKTFTLSFIFTILLSACGASPTASPTPDIYAIYTAAAETVIAEFTKTAAASPPTQAAASTATQGISTATLVPTSIQTATPTLTSTPEPTATTLVEASPTDVACDNAIYVADTSVPDNTEMSPGQNFEKTWSIKNTGTCTWGEGYSIVFGYGEEMGGQAQALPSVVLPEESVEIVVIFSAPLLTGEHKSFWRMANPAGYNFGEYLSVNIVVR